jgi:hypothetical protein
MGHQGICPGWMGEELLNEARLGEPESSEKARLGELGLLEKTPYCRVKAVMPVENHLAPESRGKAWTDLPAPVAMNVRIAC